MEGPEKASPEPADDKLRLQSTRDATGEARLQVR